MIYCGAKLKFASVVFYYRWLESLEQAEAFFLFFFPKQWCTMILTEIGQYRRLPKSWRSIPPVTGFEIRLGSLS